MGKLAALMSTRATYQQALSTLKEPAAWLEDWFRGGRSTASGKDVTEQNALKCGVIYACVNVYATSVASVPWNLQRRLKRGKERAVDHHLFDVLKYEPNPLMSSYVFRETLEGHHKTWGNCYARIERDTRRQVTALWPMRPDWMTVKLVRGEKVYEYQRPDGGPPDVLFADDVFHIPGLGFDGLVGYSPIRMAMESIGWTMATHEYGASFFGNSSRIAGVLKHPGTLSADAAKNLREQWEELRKGSRQAHKTAVLEEGVSWEQIGIPQDEAQFIETMQFQIEDICRWYNMPPHKVQQLLHATFSNIEHSQLAFYVDTIRPEYVRWEQETDRQLLTREERRAGLFTEFLMDAILRGDSKTRHETYAIGRQWGYYSPNDVLEKESQNPIEVKEGDDYHIPVNMVPLQESSLAVRPAPTQGGPGDGNHQPRSVGDRMRARRASVPIFRDAAARVGRREADQVRKAARKFAGDREGFIARLREFYGDEFRDGFARDFVPVLASYAALMSTRDVDQEEIDDLACLMAGRYSRTSIGALSADDCDAEALLVEWAATRPDEVAASETIRAAAALA